MFLFIFHTRSVFGYKQEGVNSRMSEVDSLGYCFFFFSQQPKDKSSSIWEFSVHSHKHKGGNFFTKVSQK